MWLHSYGVMGKMTNISLQILCWIQRWKNFKIVQYLAKLLTKNVVVFLSHCVCVIMKVLLTASNIALPMDAVQWIQETRGNEEVAGKYN